MEKVESGALNGQATILSAKLKDPYEFEKIFAANVVSMSDLRTLAWNGIPVGFFLWRG